MLPERIEACIKPTEDMLPECIEACIKPTEEEAIGSQNIKLDGARTFIPSLLF